MPNIGEENVMNMNKELYKKPQSKKTFGELIAEGYKVQGEPKFYLSEAGLPAADVRLVKPGEKLEYRKGVYGKDENIPGGRQHRFGKTEKQNGERSIEAVKAAQRSRAKAKSAERLNPNSGTGQKNKDGSVKGAGLGKGSYKKDHK
jgi:hypothetical protein